MTKEHSTRLKWPYVPTILDSAALHTAWMAVSALRSALSMPMETGSTRYVIFNEARSTTTGRERRVCARNPARWMEDRLQEGRFL